MNPTPTPTPERQPTPLLKDNQRQLDLVRQMRGYLHAAGLITEEEYAYLTMIGSKSARRLEDYDDLAVKLSTLTAQNAELARRLEEAIERGDCHLESCKFLQKQINEWEPERATLKAKLTAAVADSRRLAVAAKAHIQAHYNFEVAKADYEIQPTPEHAKEVGQAYSVWIDAEKELEPLITAAMSAQH